METTGEFVQRVQQVLRWRRLGVLDVPTSAEYKNDKRRVWATLRSAATCKSEKGASCHLK